jgi:hypothetical protein
MTLVDEKRLFPACVAERDNNERSGFFILTHFHSLKSAMVLFTSSKNEYSTAAVEIAIDRPAVAR